MSPGEQNPQSGIDAEGEHLLPRPSPEPTPSSPPPTLKKGRGAKILDGERAFAAGKGEHEDLALDLLLYSSTHRGAGLPSRVRRRRGAGGEGARGAAEEEGVALEIAQAKL